MIRFIYEDKIYSYIPFEDLKLSDLPDAKRSYKSKYLDLDCGFDIETSSNKDLKLSWLYMWQFSINDTTIIGRTWRQFQEFLEILGHHYDNEKGYRILCWIHNANFEFSFAKNWLKFKTDKEGKPEVFALNPREVIKFTTVQNIEFRDSSVLTNVSLKKLAKDYKTGLEKLTEAIDYNEILTPATPLDNPRIAYAINDVQILAKFNKQYIKPYYLKKGFSIPLTSTAIPRNEMKRNFKKLPQKERQWYKNQIVRSFPTEQEYTTIMRWLYRGGYVHGSIADMFQYFENSDAYGEDRKSSYPAEMLQKGFPWRFVTKNRQAWYKIKDDFKFMEEKAFYVHLRFKNIRAKTTHAIESKHKLFKSKKCYFDNGRLVAGKMIEVYLTEYDWQSYREFYTWDKVKCISYHVASKEPLPTFLRDMVLEYFEDKEKLDRDSLDYMLQKRKLNSLYGMTVAGLFNDELVLNDNGILEPSGNKKDFDEIVKSQLLLPYFGIWISAGARRELLKIVSKLDYDNCYSDTDSCKVFNYHANKYIFDDYNDRIRRINKNMYVGEHDRSIYSEIGTFVNEGKLWKFQTNGCKRYIYTTAEKNKETGKYELCDHVTIAGMRKGTLEKKAKDEGVSVYSLFKDGLELDKLSSDKLTTAYFDKEFTLPVVDYLGYEYDVYERSCCTLVEIGFKMTIAQEFINYYKMYQEKEKLIVGERFI